MPSFDIVSRFNFAELDNAINNTLKAIASRFDFRGATAEISVDRKEKKLRILTDDGTKLRGIREMFESAAHRRGLDLKAFKWGEGEAGAAGKLKCEVKIQDGIEQDIAKQIVKQIKDSKLKVQASIQGEEVRVNGKQIDDLQSVIRLLNGANLGLPLQFVNMKS
ncbi:MAG: YajQ family cyclic di-GMP-binding protein [Phycisphaeraceae bacterium]|nr:YajQ family cyclic di-GMP-binding protein [Phycisphaeraceae bacterium]